MLSTCSSVAGAAPCRPLQPAAHSASPAAAAAKLNARQFSADPLVELSYDILLGHDHAAYMRSRPQSQLIELAHLRIFGHDAIGEIHHVAHVELGISQGLRRKQVLDAQLCSFGSQGKQAHHAYVVYVTHQKYGGQAGHVDMSCSSILF